MGAFIILFCAQKVASHKPSQAAPSVNTSVDATGEAGTH
jgi:hypothetical protein